jgi:single-strand DNA-binding protein
MADLSIAVLVGRLTRDAELKYTNSGQAVCHFSVATSSRRKKGDQWVDEASFWEVDLWGKQGESINQYLTKGKLVAVEGAMRQDRWEQDGQSRMKVIVSANTVQLLGGGQGSGGSGGQSYGGQGTGSSAGSPQSSDNREWQGRDAPRSQGPAPKAPESDDFSDDIPF